jgi:ActR/RegA family two-component response regulator
VPAAQKFLVIDYNPDGLALLARTMMRKFPHAMLMQCLEPDAAVAAARAERLDAVVVHRPLLVEGVEMIRLLREVDPDVPILMVSGIDRTNEAIKAGATRFLPFDEWLKVGTVVAEMLETVSGPRD